MTDYLKELLRCEQELDLIRNFPANGPDKMLVQIGELDWLTERRIILTEAALRCDQQTS